jgi:microcystin-dependent protein
MKTNIIYKYGLLLIALNVIMVNIASAGVPAILPIQGRLLGADGNPLADGTYQAILRIYNSSTGGVLLWQEDETFDVKNGIFSSMLGEQVPINIADSITGLWASVQIGLGTEELQPRMKIGSVPFSFKSGKSDSSAYSVNAQMSVHAVNADTSKFSKQADTASYAMNGVPVGVIMPFAGNPAQIPQGWLLCDGSALSSSDYPQLYSVISTFWGNGSSDTTGTKNFNLPDLRGLFLRGVDNGAGKDPDAQFRQPIQPGGNSGDIVGSFQDLSPSNSSTLNTSSSNQGIIPMYDSQGYRYSSNTEAGQSAGTTQIPPNAAVNYIIKVR